MTTVYQQIGKFEIVRKLGRGGMGDVYLARDSEAGRTVALKLLERAGDQDSLDAFAAERHGAILQARLCGLDPHVARVYEYGELDRFFFIAMEHVEGNDLSTLLATGPLPAAQALDIATQVCSLLVTAHGLQLTVEGESYHGVIHGDVKPKNIRIAPDGRVKVLDFGIAKALSLTRKLTRNEFGSVAYSSPERLETGQVDVHSDLWSVGVVLYEMLAGRQPYSDVNTHRLEEAIRSRRAPPALPSSVSVAVQRVVARALSPDLARRYPTANDFRADLVALSENRPTIADLDPTLLHDPDVTRRTIVNGPESQPVDPDRTRRSMPPAADGRAASASPTPPPSPAAAASPSPPSTKAPRLSRLRRSARIALILLLVVTAWREMLVLNAAGELRDALPLKERTDMDAVWGEYRALEARSPLGIGIARLKGPLKRRLVDLADRVITTYRSDITIVRKREWEAARRDLSRALMIGGDDPLVRARLRYCEGHLNRIDGDARDRPPQEARTLYNDAVVAFQEAARLNARWPDPYLGLARVYFYGLEDLEKGADAIAQAEKAGFKPGNRETAQLADAYRRRGERLWREALAVRGLPQEREVLERAAEADRNALRLYERIIGFGDARIHLPRTQGHLQTIEERLADIRRGFRWPPW